jgi:hypothetical protein
VLRIYGFNLVLLGVNLAGTLSSIVQGITASKAPFARTPKVKDRTVVPPFLLIAPYLVIRLAGFTLYRAYVNRLTENFAYAALNVILACYAAKAFIGLRNSLVDLCIHGTSLLYRPAERRKRLTGLWRRPVEEPRPTDWRSVLQAGYAEPQYQSAGGRPMRMPPTTAGPAAPSAPDGPARRRLSLARVLVALVVLAGAGYGGYAGLKTRLLASATVVHKTWFAPYVDVTPTPTYQFQSTSADPSRQSVLGFVVAAGKSGCTPSWGGAYSLNAADQQLAVGARIAQLQQEGEQRGARHGSRAGGDAADDRFLGR